MLSKSRNHVLDHPNQVVSVWRLQAQPAQNLLGIAVDVPHKWNLTAFSLRIALIDTDRIDS